MAIGIIKQPADYQPIHTPLMLQASSSNSNQIDFKFKITINIAGVVLNRTLYVSPRPVDANLELDLATHLRDYLDYDDFVMPFAANFVQAPYVDYTITIAESWQGVDQEVLVTLEQKTASNVLLNRQEWLQNMVPTFDYFHIKEDGVIDEDVPPKVLLYKPLGATMYTDELYYVHVVGKTDNDNLNVRVNQIDEAGVVLPQLSVLSAPVAVVNSKATFAKIDLSTMTFNPLTKRISLTFNDGLSNAVTETAYFDIREYECTPWERWRLFYMDKEGSYNNFSLDMIHSKEFNAASKTYRKRIDPLTDTSRKRAVNRYTQRTAKKFMLNTDYMNEATAATFEDLLQSHRVFRDVRNVDGWDGDDFLPIEILTSGIKSYAPGSNDMPQYEIEARYSFENNARHE